MINRLRRRFIIVTMISVFLVLFAIMCSVNVMNYINITGNADRTLSIIVENKGTFPKFVPGTPPGPSGEFGTRPEMNGPAPEMADLPVMLGDMADEMMDLEAPFNTRYFTVTLDDNGTVKATNADNIAAITADQAAELAKSLWSDAGGRATAKNGYEGIYRYTSFETDDGDVMFVFLDCNRELSSFSSFVMVSSAVAALAVVLVLILVIILSGRVLRPVAESYEKQKSFITNASHEIKTPLAIIDANVDVMEMIGGETEWTRSTKHQIRRLSSLTEKLVFLSRMDEANTMLPMEEFDLAEAVSDTAGSFGAVADSRGKQLEILVPEECTYYGNEEIIRQAVSLLVDNAMKYSDENGEILVSLMKQGGHKIIRVENSVEHTENGNLDMLFERFYRPDESRSTETGGHGIGLSVVRAIAEAHKGKVSAEGRNGDWIVFTVTL